MLRLHFPLIEPDVRISRIRLSDQGSRCRTRDVAGQSRELQQTQFPMKVFMGVQIVSQPLMFVLASQPLTEPILGVLIDVAVSVAHRAAAEVIRPALEHPIQLLTTCSTSRSVRLRAVASLILALRRLTALADGLVLSTIRRCRQDQ